jgi:hypothetical protein
MQFSLQACGSEARPGCHLTTLFGSTDVSTVAPIPSVASNSNSINANSINGKKKHSMLPILTVLFLISYGLMTMLIVEQSSTIESQRALIRELFRDSNELSAVKGRAIEGKFAQDQQRAQTQAPLSKAPSNQMQSSQTPSTQIPSNQIPSNQVHTPAFQTPSTQRPSHQAPSTQVVPQQRAQKTNKIDKPLFQAPPKPAEDQADDRRAFITI